CMVGGVARRIGIGDAIAQGQDATALLSADDGLAHGGAEGGIGNAWLQGQGVTEGGACLAAQCIAAEYGDGQGSVGLAAMNRRGDQFINRLVGCLGSAGARGQQAQRQWYGYENSHVSVPDKTVMQARRPRGRVHGPGWTGQGSAGQD